MVENLPPLKTLRAFEAAGRHLSFTRAAKELHVTQAAVSHQIKALETWLDVPLFKRLNRSLLLTEPGQHYLLSVRKALELLAEATQQIVTTGGNDPLTISVMPSFGAKWLVSRLVRFGRQHPEIDLRFSAEDKLTDFTREDVDIAIRFGRGVWPGLDAALLMRQDVFPVCSPSLLEDGPHPLRTPDDLRHHVLLHERPASYDWRTWLLAAGIDDVDPIRGPSFSHAHMLLQATIDGQGVALGATPLVDDDLAEGRLVKPFDLTLPGEWAYYVVCPEARAEEQNIKFFREWILGEAKREPSP
jgi:LysR family glycine cleavage system transcriptional activator